jgi:predicted membrane protein (TIGR00267 family)
MRILHDFRRLIYITHSHGILRRYFVVNGFDGALTMLGLMMGFKAGGESDLRLAVGASVGAAIALGISGLTSAYVSESAERQRELRELEVAMAASLADTAHGRASRLVPMFVAVVNGLAPLLISLLIILPLWMASLGLQFPWSPFDATLGVAFAVIFLLGVFLGRVSHRFWLWTGIRAALIAAVTAGLILLIVA